MKHRYYNLTSDPQRLRSFDLDLQFESINPSFLAEQCAADQYANHGGSRLDWPMTIEVMDLGEDDTTVVRGSFRINMRMEPTFHADATTADESSDARVIAVPVDPKL